MCVQLSIAHQRSDWCLSISSVVLRKYKSDKIGAEKINMRGLHALNLYNGNWSKLKENNKQELRATAEVPTYHSLPMKKKLENKLQTSVLSGIFDLGFQPRSGIPGSVSVWKLYYTSAVKHFIFLLHQEMRQICSAIRYLFRGEGVNE